MVNWENYEEYMLLYADNELNTAEREALFAFVRAHPELHKELELYQATRLIPEAMVYGNKDALLKKGGGSISLGNWWIYAAAAAILVFAVFIVKQNGTHQEITTPIAKTKTAQPPIAVQPNADTSHELHSTPVKPVTIENTLARHQPARADKKNELPKTPTQPQQVKEETYITKEEPKQQEMLKTPVVEQKEEKTVAATSITAQEQLANETSIEPAVEKKHRKLLAWLPINRQRNESANAIAEVVTEKLEKVKEIKNNLKDADVTFKIGNRELFVVKL